VLAKHKSILIIIISLILVSSYIGMAYACYIPPGNTPIFGNDYGLKIKDQDESWRDGVHGTWTAVNMAPGHEYAFTDSYIGLQSQTSKLNTLGYVNITCDYNVWKQKTPDAMAVYMDITRCVYYYKTTNQLWQIDCLTGIQTRLSPAGSQPAKPNLNWKIQDVDNDKRITFHDLKMRPLVIMPLYSGYEARFEMSIRLDAAADNKFQKSVFNLKMIYNCVSP
jgi:hypothetical protein